MKKCLIFDLDDTLYSEHHYVLSGFKAVSLFLEQEYAATGFYKQACRLFEAKERGNIFNQALDAMALDYSNELIKKLVRVYRAHKPMIKLFDDAQWALNYFSKEYRLGLITDGYFIAQQQKINALNIAAYFEEMVITDALGREYWKPHEKPYLTIQSKMHVLGRDCLYIGDNVSKDFVTANQLGWQTIQVIREQGEYADIDVSVEFKAQQTVTSLRELEQII